MLSRAREIERSRLLAGSAFFLFSLMVAMQVMPGLAQSIATQPGIQAGVGSGRDIRVSGVSVAAGSSTSDEEKSVAYDSLPDAPGWQAAQERAGRSLSGTVTDPHGAEVSGAQVTLSNGEGIGGRTLTSDGAGFFSFGDMTAGVYKLTIAAAGFSTWVTDGIVLREGESYDVPRIVLRVAMATTSVDVVMSRYDLAQEQVKAQERQRVLGIFPNFFVSYVWDAIPLTSGQKFRLAFRQAIDPEAFVGAGFGAALEMWQKDYVGYGNGAKGYFTRTAALYGDGFNNSLIAGAILPSLLHQDPRYFYKGTGTTGSRVRYALSRTVICRGDDGRPEPNYSNVLGALASAGVSNAYYPPANRGARLVFDNAAIALAANSVGSLFQEFLLRKISHGVQP